MPRHTPHETAPETAHEASTAAPGVPRRAVLPEEMTAVRALVFDVFGTVVDWRGGVARQSAPFLRRHAPAVDPYDFADRWRAEYQPAMERVRSGERPFVRLDELHRENLDRVLAGLGTDPDAVAVAERDELNLVWRRLDPWPDVIAGLRSLREQYIIAPCPTPTCASHSTWPNGPDCPETRSSAPRWCGPTSRLRTPTFAPWTSWGWNRPRSPWSPRTMTILPLPGPADCARSSYPAGPSTDPGRSPTLRRKVTGTSSPRVSGSSPEHWVRVVPESEVGRVLIAQSDRAVQVPNGEAVVATEPILRTRRSCPTAHPHRSDALNMCRVHRSRRGALEDGPVTQSLSIMMTPERCRRNGANSNLGASCNVAPPQAGRGMPDPSQGSTISRGHSNLQYG